jgi:hypothetical protein
MSSLGEIWICETSSAMNPTPCLACRLSWIAELGLHPISSPF